MGLAVATSLSTRPDWSVQILDLHAERGHQAASSLNATFHQSNVTNDTSLAAIFKTVYAKHNRLDFVFANAGIAEHANFFEPQEVDDDPVLPVKGLHAIVDINLKSVITTSYLALHYMRKSPGKDKSLVMTASCGGLYPSYYSPIYTATKHAVVGFTRSVAPYYHTNAGIRVNAICPGTVKTNLLSSKEWENFPEEYFTPVEKIAEVVCMLVDGEDDGTGKVGEEVKGGMESITKGALNGRAVEVSGRNHYYREMVGYCDEGMRAVMGATNIEVLENAEDV
ncbi:NAD(P)-binding protein [Trematosphaeria pertusa]|uniref:NAD(P)-binding protein n=1 Tax=Trematosphaeria pertusa TaxID=390896 RepID=A0A6A6HWN4_9PLEO|nr:NAD(P)-binding protein [Trematosphaeria pertusa]KAF2242178.1 NAD(P)-binding protein [Trematosphaeria pertusa]